MELSLIFLILGFVVFAFLIFKFIKKIVVAIISFVFLVLLIVGGAFGLIYLDLNNMASKSDFSVNVIYGSSKSPQFGVSLPVENQSVDVEEITSYDSSQLSSVDLDDKEGDIYVFMPKELFETILSEDLNYYIEGTEDAEVEGYNVDMSLTKSEIIQIMNYNDPEQKFAEIVYSKNSQLSSDAVNSIKTYVDDEFTNVGVELEEVLFISATLQSITEDNMAAGEFAKGFQSEDLEVRPDRLTFTIARMIPVSMIVDNLPVDKINSNS